MQPDRVLIVALCACLIGSCVAPGSVQSLQVDAEGGLRMRTEATTESQTILTIPNETTVQVLDTQEEILEIGGRTGSWTQVQYEDKEGWVFGGFLVEPGTTTESETESLYPEERDSLTIGLEYHTSNGQLTLKSDGRVQGSFGEFNGCDYAIESGTWSEEPGKIIARTQGTVSGSCPTGAKRRELIFTILADKKLDEYEPLHAQFCDYAGGPGVLCHMTL